MMSISLREKIDDHRIGWNNTFQDLSGFLVFLLT